MKILARHLTADLFNCKNSRLTDTELIKENLQDTLKDLNFRLIHLDTEPLEDCHVAIMSIFQEGHLTMDIYTDLKYVAIDIFLCRENAEPDKIARNIRSFFKPDKVKTTVLKRGNFGSAKDIRPKVRTKVAPLRRIHNTGAKVIRALARRNHK